MYLKLVNAMIWYLFLNPIVSFKVKIAAIGRTVTKTPTITGIDNAARKDANVSSASLTKSTTVYIHPPSYKYH